MSGSYFLLEEPLQGLQVRPLDPHGIGRLTREQVLVSTVQVYPLQFTDYFIRLGPTDKYSDLLEAYRGILIHNTSHYA